MSKVSIDIMEGIKNVSPDEIRRRIDGVMREIKSDLLGGVVTEPTAFDVLCQRLSAITGIPTERLVAH